MEGHPKMGKDDDDDDDDNDNDDDNDEGEVQLTKGMLKEILKDVLGQKPTFQTRCRPDVSTQEAEIQCHQGREGIGQEMGKENFLCE